MQRQNAYMYGVSILSLVHFVLTLVISNLRMMVLSRLNKNFVPLTVLQNLQKEA